MESESGIWDIILVFKAGETIITGKKGFYASH